MTHHNSDAAPGAGDRNAIPKELKELRRWITWKLDAKGSKVPSVSTNNLEALRRLADIEGDRIGFVLTNGVNVPNKGRLYAFDLDACHDPKSGALASWAQQILEHYKNTYWEITPSGAGLRFFLFVKHPPPKLGKAFPHDANFPETLKQDGKPKKQEMQIFGQGPAQYVTVSGNRLEDTPSSVGVVNDLEWLINTFNIRGASSAAKSSHRNTRLDEPLASIERRKPTAEEVERIQRVFDQDERLKTLAKGRWISTKKADGSQRYPSASEAYFELVRGFLLAFEGDQELAALALLWTTWGRGRVKSSSDPKKYAKPSWVRAEIARAAAWIPPHTSGVFEPIEAEGEQRRPADRPRSKLGSMFIGERLANRSSTRWLFKNWLPADGVFEIFGDPSCGKSTVAMSIAAHALAGRDWMGHRYRGPRDALVFYIASEDAYGIDDRAKAACELVDLDIDRSPFVVLDGTVSLIDRSSQDALIAEIRGKLEECTQRNGERPAPLALVIVDTFSKNFGGKDENSSTETTNALGGAQRIAREFQTCVLSIHHNGHSEKNRSRGSSAILAALDGSFQVSRRAARDDILDVTMTKARRMALPKTPTVCTLETVPLGTDEDGDEITTVRIGAIPFVDEIPCDESLDDRDRAILKVVGDNPDRLSAREVARELADEDKRGWSEPTLRNRTGQLLEVGRLLRTRGQKLRLAPPGAVELA
ncbi:MAG: AAA family ATPase [Planctomycetes bacterium]|nr:AAA family ATPase [Planctomycetota bacterium]